jgi:hypothetical protein
MLIEVAKRDYLRAHPARARTPRGFTKGIELHLTEVEAHHPTRCLGC